MGITDEERSLTIEQTLTDQERLAELSLGELQQLVGLVEYDAARCPFPVTGWDAVVWVVGNPTQSAHFFSSAFGMELVAYSGPSTGNRDHHAYVLKSGAVRFVLKGGVDPASEMRGRRMSRPSPAKVGLPRRLRGSTRAAAELLLLYRCVPTRGENLGAALGESQVARRLNRCHRDPRAGQRRPSPLSRLRFETTYG